IFSLGVVLYEMAAGAPAFPGATTAEVFAAVLAAEPPPLSSYGAGLPADIDAIVSKALAKQRALRYPTMQDFAADLRGLKKRLEAGGAPPLSRRAGVLLAGTALAAALGLAWYAWTPTAGSQRELPVVVPLTSFAGFKDFAALSPDGRAIAFSWNGGQGGS